MKHTLTAFLSILFISPSYADICSKYKSQMSEIKINYKDIPWKLNIYNDMSFKDFNEKFNNKEKSVIDKDSTGGLTISNIKYSNRIYGFLVNIEGGYCLFIDKIDTSFGIEDFNVYIDDKYPDGSCIYSAIYNHELKHVKSEINLISEYKDEYIKIIKNQANKTEPIFVKSEEEVDKIFDDIANKITESSEMKIFRDKIQKEENNKAKEIDPDIETAKKILQCREDNL